MKFENESLENTLHNTCPDGGDASEDCKDCVYGEEYHLANGECRLRTYEPSEKHLGAPKEVTR